MIVSQAWVKAYLPGKDPVGKRLRFAVPATQPYREIVGLVEDNIAYAQLDNPGSPVLFCPFDQAAYSYINYVVGAAINPAVVPIEVRDVLSKTDPQLFREFSASVHDAG